MSPRPKRLWSRLYESTNPPGGMRLVSRPATDDESQVQANAQLIQSTPSNTPITPQTTETYTTSDQQVPQANNVPSNVDQVSVHSPVNHALLPPGRGGVQLPVSQMWRPGESGNPRGRPSAGLAVIEWINQLQDTPEAELIRIAGNEHGAPNKRAAAGLWLAALGNPEHLDRILDRTHGKPKQTIESTSITVSPLELMLASLGSERLGLLVDTLQARALARAQPADAVIDVEAKHEA